MNAAKRFKVAAVSSNTNSFGLHAMVLMAEDGETWRVLTNQINIRQKGEVVSVPITTDPERRHWEKLGYETPERFSTDILPTLAKEVWAIPIPKKS